MAAHNDPAHWEALLPLASIMPLLRRARLESWAVPLFDTVDSLCTEGMLAAAEEARAPVIIAIYSGLLDRPEGPALAAYVRTRAEGAAVPMSLMLDHGGSVEHCRRALDLGFTDVMFDGSELPVDENIEVTREVVAIAHARRAGAEAELGHVGVGSSYQAYGAQGRGFTDPATVERFVAETGVDCLAVAVGTAHGHYEGEARVDLVLLREIAQRVALPLVMHGGSGVPDEQVRAAIGLGVAKVNIATDLFIAAGRVLAEAAATTQSYFGLTRASVDRVRDECMRCIALLGAEGRAGECVGS